MTRAYPIQWRISIVKAWFAASIMCLATGPAKFWDNVGEQFRFLVPDHTVVDLRGFANRWVSRFETTGSVDELPHIGAHLKLPDDVARECVSQLLAGYDTTVTEPVYVGQGPRRRLVSRRTIVVHRWYSSLKDAIRRNKYVREVMQEYHISECTLWRRLQHVAPGLKRRHLHPKKGLSAINMKARVELCQKLLEMGRDEMVHYLSRCFFIDSKTFYVCPESVWVYAPPGAEMTVTDPRLPASKYATRKIVYYAVVNAILGPVYVELVTGTSEHVNDPFYQEYKVSFESSTTCPWHTTPQMFCKTWF